MSSDFQNGFKINFWNGNMTLLKAFWALASDFPYNLLAKKQEECLGI